MLPRLLHLPSFHTLVPSLLALLPIVSGRSLKASSLVACMDDSQVTASYFDVQFDPDSGALRYTFDFTSEISDYILADVDVYAYGFKIISQQIDLCDIGWKQFCPIYPGEVEIDSIEYISDEYVKMIPGISYTVPDIDAFARVKVRNSNGTQVACMQAYFTNGKTVSQVGAKWATAVVAGIGLLSSAIASAFGNSNAATYVAANAVALFLYFQSVVVVAMMRVDEVPPIAAAWSENLAWSMGLIRVGFMQSVFRWYVQATGGTPALLLTSSTINVLTQRSLTDYIPSKVTDYVSSGLVKRMSSAVSSGMSSAVSELRKRADPIVLYGNSNVLILRGIKRLAYQANIESTSVVCTGFTFFVLCAYVLVFMVLSFRFIICDLLLKFNIFPNQSSTLHQFKQSWKSILKGTLSKYTFIGFTQLVILSLYEFYIRDSPAVIVLAVIILLLVTSILGWTAFRVTSYARLSIVDSGNPAAVLYGNERVLNKYGFFYTMFNANLYWWGIVVLGHSFVKGLFIALVQASGKTQAIALWLIDMGYLGALIYFKPYLNVPTNVIAITIQLVTTLNSFMFTFFSNIFGQPAAVASIMGWVFFILNAAFSLILLIMILLLCGYAVFSKNPDARFRPAQDDRTSFQRLNQSQTRAVPHHQELLALGQTAKDHNDDWETEIHKLQDLIAQNAAKDKPRGQTPDIDDESHKVTLTENEKESFAGKIVRKLTTGKSFKRSKSRSQKNNPSQKGLLHSKNSVSHDGIGMATNHSNSSFDLPTKYKNLDPSLSDRYHNKHDSVNQACAITTTDFITSPVASSGGGNRGIDYDSSNSGTGWLSHTDSKNTSSSGQNSREELYLNRNDSQV